MRSLKVLNLVTSSSGKKRVIVSIFGLIALIGALTVRWMDPDGLKIARFLVFDQYQQILPREYEPAPVRVIAIDEESLQRYGQWPWPRYCLLYTSDAADE